MLLHRLNGSLADVKTNSPVARRGVLAKFAAAQSRLSLFVAKSAFAPALIGWGSRPRMRSTTPAGLGGANRVSSQGPLVYFGGIDPAGLMELVLPLRHDGKKTCSSHARHEAQQRGLSEFAAG